MKTRSFLEGPSNIAAIVKARRNASEQECTPFSQIGNDPLLTVIQTNSNVNITDNLSFANITQTLMPEKKVITKTLWSVEDKILFFTAIKTYGKNFNEISRFMKSRGSKLNPKKIGKSKEQVRVFYNRTYNLIKPFLKFSPDIPQSVQELYALINYSVFRTRFKKVLTTRMGEKLNEMVMNGSTLIKSNGKRITLRTPVCPALKRLNNLKTPEQEYSIPDDVIIEMVPRNYVTLWRVQQIEQNPRMRLKVAVNRQLSDVMTFLNNKLKNSAQMIRETLGLPQAEAPKLHIRLSDDARFLKEICIQEVSKPRFDSITFKSYCENILKQSSPVLNRTVNNNQPSESAEKENSGPDTSNVQQDNSFVKIDFNDMQRKLSAGIGIEEARDMKVLALYIGMGCPSAIKFLYEYLHPSDMGTAENSVSNGLRRLLHLSKHDYLENKLNKDIKSQLEIEISDMQQKLADMKRELMTMEEERFNDFNNRFDNDEFSLQTVSAKSEHVNNQTHRPYVYKKQQEALKQLMEDLPNKNNVVINQIEYASDKNSALDNVKRFHKNRKRPKSVNNIAVPAVYTLKLPLAIQEPSTENMMETNDNMFGGGIGAGGGGMSNMYSAGMMNNGLYLNHIAAPQNHQMVCMNNSNNNIMSTMLNQSLGTNQNIINIDHCENTNDSLRSFLNDMTESQGMDQLSTDCTDYQGIFHNFLYDSNAKTEELNISINQDSETGSLTQFLNTLNKHDK